MQIVDRFNRRIDSSLPGMQAASNLSKRDVTIINDLAKEFQDLSRKNIQSWRQALESTTGETPKWADYQDLIEYLMPDGHLGSQWEIRNGAIEASRFLIRSKKTRKEDTEKTNLIEDEWMLNLMGNLLDSLVRKYTLLQIAETEAINFELIPRRNIVPQKRMILKSVTGETGWSFDDPAFAGKLVYMEAQTPFGIFNDIIPDLIWKKNSRQAWAEFSEKFGIPLISATTTSRDKKDLDRIQAMLKALGQAAQAVLPAGTVIDIKDSATKGDPYKIYLEQIKYCDEQISKRFLGGTMISDNGSSRSQSEVHERTLNYIISELGRKRIEFVMNKQVLPVLALKGLPFTEDDEFVFDRTESLTLKEQWDIINQALEHYDIPDEYVSETFAFPINGRKQKQESGFFDPAP